jgi:hypothetical protein
MATGGSIQSISLNGRGFTATADNEAGIMLGGFSNEVQMNADSTARKIMLRVPWKVTGLVLGIDQTQGDAQFLQDIADQKGMVAVEMTLADDTVYSGTGTIEGDLSASTMASSISLELAGGGKLTA